MADGGSPFDDVAGPGASSPSPEELARFELNDIGNAQRLIRLAGGQFDDDGEPDLSACRLLYLQDQGWIGFNGQRWDLRHGERQATRLAHQVAAGLWEQANVVSEWRMEKLARKADAAETAGESKEAEKLRKVKPETAAADFYDFALQSGNAGRTSSMLKQATAYLTVDLEVFDRNRLAINCRNGTLKLLRPKKRGEPMEVRFGPHDPADRITRLADVDYDPDAPAAVWAASLQAWQPADPMRDFLQRISGYCATGFIHEQVFFLFQGLGRDGKSTFVGAIRETLGDYGVACDVKTFLDIGQRSGADANPDLARLAGDSRLISTAEPPRGAKLAEAMIKSFTGGAPILARRLRQDPFEFTPIGKIIMECNSFPAVRGDDDGIWRRLVPILWEAQVPKDKVDRELPGKLSAERSGILNWIVAGIAAWLDKGLDPPPRVAEALEDYRKGSSPFGEWMSECVVKEKDAKELAGDLYRSFKDWCLARDADAKVMTQTTFGRALADRQIIRAGLDGAGRVLRAGARLKTTSEIEADRVGFASATSGRGSVGDFEGSNSGADAPETGLPTGDWV